MTSTQEKIDFLAGQIHSKHQWLQDHGEGTKRPWPSSDIEAKQRHLVMLESILQDYVSAQQRKAS
jgi:hypothetical protein